MHSILNYLTTIPSSTWTTLLAYLAGSAGVASLLQLLKKKLHIDSAKVISALLGLFSFVAAAGDYIINQATQNPSVLGRNTAYIVSLAFFVHRFAVSPLFGKLEKSLLPYVSDVNAYHQARKASAVTGADPQPLSEFHIQA